MVAAEPPRACAVTSLCLTGPRAARVTLELQYTGGLMQRIVLTGLAGGTVREARDRLRGCLERCGLPVPRRSVLANFAPADLPKSGNGFDLPLALGVLCLEGVVDAPALTQRAVVGELALDGHLRPVRGALTLALAARRAGIERLLLPHANGAEASLVDGLQVEAVRSLPEALEVLGGRPAPAPPAAREVHAPHRDLADVRGQDSARRALEVAAAGRHNLLLSGPPGTGKTMLAQRLPGLLPPLSGAEQLEVSALHGLTGGPATLHRQPPFRAPHHTLSRAGLIGGGTPLAPGEVSLAHRGVLFLDELAEFPRTLLDALRQPLEDGRVAVARAGRQATFPARVQLVGAMNPCPCGYLGHPRRTCRCTPGQLQRYHRRLSGPLLDRFDMAVEVGVPPADALLSRRAEEGSAAVAARVATARRRRAAGPLSCPRGLRRHLGRAAERFGLSARAVGRLLDVAHTVAALDGRATLAAGDLDEALSYRLGLLPADGAPSR